MAKVTGIRPALQTDGSPAGNTIPEARTIDAAGNEILLNSVPAGPAETPYEVPLNLNATQAANSVSAQHRVKTGGGIASDWVDVGAPEGGFLPVRPNPPTNGAVSN